MMSAELSQSQCRQGAKAPLSRSCPACGQGRGDSFRTCCSFLFLTCSKCGCVFVAPRPDHSSSELYADYEFNRTFRLQFDEYKDAFVGSLKRKLAMCDKIDGSPVLMRRAFLDVGCGGGAMFGLQRSSAYVRLVSTLIPSL